MFVATAAYAQSGKVEIIWLNQSAFKITTPVSAMRVSPVVNGTRPVTAELALLFGRAFKQAPQYWLNLQAAHDLKAAQPFPRRSTARRAAAGARVMR